MKHSIKGKKHHPTPQAKPPLPQAAAPSIKRWAILVCCLLLAAGASWAFMEFVVWNKLPSELVGTWEVVQGPPEYKEAEFQFYRSGKMIGHFNDNGMDRPIYADVQIEGDKLSITTRRQSTGEEHVSVQTIRTLNETELVVADERGKIMKMRRIP